MSDEPKKQPRWWVQAWIWWALLALIVLYPLSMGPVLKTCDADGLYAPIFYLTRVLPGSFGVVQWYCGLWKVFLIPVRPR